MEDYFIPFSVHVSATITICSDCPRRAGVHTGSIVMVYRLRRADRAPGRCRAGRGLLGGKDPTGRFRYSALAPALVELGHVEAVHVAVAVVVQEPEEAHVASALAEAAQHDVEVGVIHVMVAIRVA